MQAIEDAACRPMQTKALNLFWHKAELRLIELPEPEAPVFAISRPTLLGGREEFILQYPARLEPPTKRDLARHRFTVRQGRKRRSFKAPDATTFDVWLHALEQALKPKQDLEQFSTPMAEGALGQGKDVDTSMGSSQRSYNLTALERPCFTRDPINVKLIRLHHPASSIANADVRSGQITLDDAAAKEEEEEVTDEDERAGYDVHVDSVDDTNDVMDDTRNGSDLETESETSNADDLAGFNARSSCYRMTEDFTDLTLSVSKVAQIDSDVRALVEAMVALVVAEAKRDNRYVNVVASSDTDDEAIHAQSTTKIEAKDGVEDKSAKRWRQTSTRGLKHQWFPLDPTNSRLIWRRCSTKSDVNSAPRSNYKRQNVHPARKWVPVDPSSTRLIWIRQDESTTTRIESRYKATSSTRKWVVLDSNNSRLDWARRQGKGGATPMVKPVTSRFYRHTKQRRH